MRGQSTFSHAIRVLACQGCGAPLQASPQGGQFTCGYCGAVNVLAQRDERRDHQAAEQARAAAMSESERYANLRAQDQVPETIPDSLRAWLVGDRLNPMYLNHALADWQACQRQLAASSTAFATEERFFYLTLLLFDHLDAARRRALLETAAELLQDARHRHVVRCRLARLAAQHGDFAAAEAWLATCNPRPTDLIMDTAYRDATATLATARADYPRVFEIVGHRPGDVPLADRQQFECELLRVHALESSGRLAEATQEVGAWVARFGVEAVDGAARAFAPLDLCTRARAAAAQGARRAQDEARLATVVAQRAKVRAGLSAFGVSLTRAPLWAFLLALLLVPLRWSIDTDPLAVVYGPLLCPSACDGCSGPARTETQWSQVGPGEWTSDGAEFFCSHPTLFEQPLSALAALSASYLILLCICWLAAPFFAVRRSWRAQSERDRLDEEIATLCRRLNRPEPGRPPYPWLRLVIFNGVVVGAAGLGVIAGLFG